MSLKLYILVDVADKDMTSLSSFLSKFAEPGYSIWNGRLKETVAPPHEVPAPIRTTLYADNYFRVYLTDNMIEFERQTVVPEHVAIANERLCRALLGTPIFSVRKWMLVEDYWDDDDNRVVNVLDEGIQPSRIPELMAKFNKDN